MRGGIERGSRRRKGERVKVGGGGTGVKLKRRGKREAEGKSRRTGLVRSKDRATVTVFCLIYLIVESRPLFSAVILTGR